MWRPHNKAFIVTRVGDTAMAVGLILLIVQTGTLNIQDILSEAPRQIGPGSKAAFWAALLLLGGALGKSAQFPLQTWLPDAMAGPAPVSALIHAATMVTAGVYLIATDPRPVHVGPSGPGSGRRHPRRRDPASWQGPAPWPSGTSNGSWPTPTISQVGYMFLALGCGAWAAAIFHFMTHAFFKALLFLGAGVVIKALGDEHDIHRMGGLRKELPVTFWTFLIGAASLSALPLVTAGFYSKDAILVAAFVSERGSAWLWAAGIAGAFLTGLYAFRMVFLVFCGEAKVRAAKRPGTAVRLPLIVLAILSLLSGFVQMPAVIVIAPVTLFTDLLAPALPALEPLPGDFAAEVLLPIAAMLVPLAAIFAAWWFFLHRPERIDAVAERPTGALIHKFLLAGWGFDALYDAVLVKPFVRISSLNRDDFVDLFYGGTARLTALLAVAAAGTQSGLIRRHALGITLGAAVGLGLVLLL